MNGKFGMQWSYFYADAAALNKWGNRVDVPPLDLEMRTPCMKATRNIAELVSYNGPEYGTLHFVGNLR